MERRPDRQQPISKNAGILQRSCVAENRWKSANSAASSGRLDIGAHAPRLRSRSARSGASPGRRSRRFPESRPPSTTGKWRIRRWVIIARAREHGGLGVDRDRRRAHHLVDRPVEHLGAMIAQAIDDVAFGDDAADLAAVDHRQRADPPLAEQGNRVARPWRRAAMVATSLPLVARIAAMVMAASVIRFRVACGLIVPRVDRQREACPTPIPCPARSVGAQRQFRRIMRWMALFSLVIAVDRGGAGRARATRALHIHMLIATALGVGLHRAARHRADEPGVPQQFERPRRPGRRHPQKGRSQ